jgi:hypothetical protein
MHSSKKKKQSFFVEDQQTPVPVRVNNKRKANHEESSQSGFAKRVKRQHNNDLAYFKHFDDTMHNYISTVISSKIKNSKNLDADLLKVKNDLTSKNILPSGILSNAASLAGLENSVMKNFMDNNGDKLVVDLFKDYVNKNFTSIADFLKQRNTSSASEISSSFEE